MREAIGPDIALTIDANCGWDVDTAIRAIRELADCRLALVEQPTPDGDYAALARVRRETDVPVMADDICFNLVHARELVRNECCDVISVYPGKHGGIRKAKQIVDFAAAARRGLLDRLEPGVGRRPRRPWRTWSWPAPTCRSRSIPATCWGPTTTRFASPRTRCASKVRSRPSRSARPGRRGRLAARAAMPLRLTENAAGFAFRPENTRQRFSSMKSSGRKWRLGPTGRSGSQKSTWTRVTKRSARLGPLAVFCSMA